MRSLIHTITWSDGKSVKITKLNLRTGESYQEDAPPEHRGFIHRFGRKSCCNAPIYKWLGIRWYGVPKPLRWFGSWGTAKDAKGCGCPVKCREAWEAIVAACLHVWNA